MELPVLSVIIPVYNVEKYLDECVNSIVNQSYKNLEIILVDDGSTDKSGAICDEWRDRDSRIKVIHKANAGLGYARNSGIEVAEGDFVAFVDSDDFIDKDMYQDLMSIAISEKSDIVYSGGFDKYLTDGSYNVVRDIQEKISVEFILYLIFWIITKGKINLFFNAASNLNVRVRLASLYLYL